MEKEGLISLLEQIYKATPEKMVVVHNDKEEEASEFVQGYLCGYRKCLEGTIELIKHIY